MADHVTLTEAELREMLEAAAEAGAKRTLAHLGLADELGVKDMREVRDLLAAWRTAKRVSFETVIKAGTTFLLLLLAGGAALAIWDRRP